MPAITGAEAAIVARAQREPAAFATLYETYFDAVYRYCFARLVDGEAAEDATSTALTNALAALPRFRDVGRAGAFRAWLFTIAHDVVVNQYRHCGRHPVTALAAAAEVPDASLSPVETALAAEAQRVVHAVLPRLTAEQRKVVELRLAGLTDAEIACVLGCRHGAIRATQYRAVLKLRTLLGAEPQQSSHA